MTRTCRLKRVFGVWKVKLKHAPEDEGCQKEIRGQDQKGQHVLLLRRADLDTLARVANNFMSNADFRNVNRFCGNGLPLSNIKPIS
jgi:hypothetical protein